MRVALKKNNWRWQKAGVSKVHSFHLNYLSKIKKRILVANIINELYHEKINDK
jgi:hypothetical protein